MPEQFVGGSLTRRPPQPRPERPAPPVPDPVRPAELAEAEAAAAATATAASAADTELPVAGAAQLNVDSRSRIAAAVDGWRRILASSELPGTLLASGPQATSSWLDLTHAHPSGLAPLFAARPTRLSSLFREQAGRAAAVRQARAIRTSAISLSAQRGVHASCLAIGVASWRPAAASGPIQAPVVLRSCSIRPRAGVDDDFDLELDDAVLINPELIRELVDTYGIEADGVRLAALTQGEKGFDPRPVYAWLEERCRSLRAFKIERSLVLATFAAGSGAVLSDLDASVAGIAAHRLLGPLASATGSVIDLDHRAETHSAAADVEIPPIETGGSPSPQLPPAQDPGSGASPPSDSGPLPAPALVPATGEHRRLAVVGRLGPRGVRDVRPPAEPDPEQELLVLDLDPAQQQAVSSVLRGDDVVIEGPPGSGATHVLAASIAGLIAAGRKVLVLSPRRSSTDSLIQRLTAAGLGELVLDARDSVTGQQATRTAAVTATLRAGLDADAGAPAELPPRGVATADGNVITTLRRNRKLLDGEAEALHAVRQPWGISVYDTMVALAELRTRSDKPESHVRLDNAALETLDPVTRERLRVHLHSAAAAGAFTLTRADTRWFDARVSTVEQAQSALEAALVLRSMLGPARAAMDAVTTSAGLRPPVFASEWVPLLEVLLGVRSVVDAMTADIYEQPLDELIAAVAPRSLRPSDGATRSDRRRLKRQARSLVRAGVYVENLYEMLILARHQRTDWQRLTQDGSGPRVVTGLTEANALAGRVLHALDVLVATFAGSEHRDPRQMPLDDLVLRVFDLAGDAKGILGQPRRATLIDGLHGAGLGSLVQDFQLRRVGPEAIDAEFDLVWWSSIRDSIVRSDPTLHGHDPVLSQRATSDLRQAEAAHIGAGAGLVKLAVTQRVSRIKAQYEDQVLALRKELAQDRRPRLIDLVRRCGDVLAAITPIWVMSPDTVAACLLTADPDQPPIVDTVVVDDAGHIALPEVVAALARGRQVVVAGDRRRQSVPGPASQSVIGALAPLGRLARLDRDHRARDGRMMMALAPSYPEGWQLTPGPGDSAPLRLELVQDGIAVPSPGEELPVSADAEVRRVLDLVQAHAARHPSESLAVVTLTERHAERIEEALRAESGDRPVLARWLAETWREGRDQAFVVRPVQRVLGLERDAVIVSIGLAKTPHGRILHRFGSLDDPSGPSFLLTALSRARNRTTVVCCFGADDLVVDRLRTPGARLLREMLLLASGRGAGRIGRTSAAVDGLVAELRDRLAGAGLPVQARASDGAWPLDVVIADGRAQGRMLVGVDVDGPGFAARACRERELHRPQRWERAGWRYLKVSALDLFADPAREVDRVRETWVEAMTEPMNEPVNEPMNEPTTPKSAPIEQTEPAEANANEAPAGVATAPVRSGLVSDGSAGQDHERPVLSEQTKDDTDEGWGEQDSSRDDELRRERPPHWG